MTNTAFDIDLDWKAIALTDPLTGTYSKLAFNIIREHKNANNEPYILFVLDLNKFKPINDTAGHQAGDKILKAIAFSLRTAMGEDIVFRWGGDEFVAIASCSEADVPGIYHRLKAAVLSTPLDEFLPEDMAGHRCGVAIGWARSEDEDAFAAADARMYKDKKN